MRSQSLVFARAAAKADPSANNITAIQAHGGAITLAMLGARNLAFSEEHQAVYELDDLTALAWHSLDAGMSADKIVHELVGTGMVQEQAEIAVETALWELRALGHTSAVSLASPAATEPQRLMPTTRLTRLTLVIAAVAVQLHLSKALVADVRAVFGPLITDLAESDAQLRARLAGNRVDFFSPGQPEWSCERSQFVTLLKTQLIELVLQHAQYEVALHAAALAQDDDAVLLVGSPGAGKTTLAIALAKAGFEVIADDVTLLNQRGLVTGVSLPFAAKASSWPLLTRHWPDILTGPSHWRPDGQELCFIPHPAADPKPHRIGSVVLLDRQPDGPTFVEELNPVCALSALIAEGATRDERLSSSGFTSLVDGLREARCCRLTYSDLIEAADAVRSLRL
jgi:hypothetical protein